jgi:hypothetical protein
MNQTCPVKSPEKKKINSVFIIRNIPKKFQVSAELAEKKMAGGFLSFVNVFGI